MLSDAEARRLLEIESLLRERDPEFVRRFDAGWTRWVWRRFPVRVAVAVALSLIVTGILVGSMIAVVSGLAVLSVGVFVLVRNMAARRRRAAG
jgi:uncharacterized membrane protein